MESEGIVRIYESRFGRRNPILEFFMGIEFDKESDTVMSSLNLKGDESVLDIACGTGIYTRKIARKLNTGIAAGLDLSWPMLEYARKQFDKEGINNHLLVHGSAMNLPFAPDGFDAVICCGALHLFPDARLAINEIGRVLKPGGICAVATFYTGEHWIYESFTSFARKIIGINSFTPTELEQYFNQTGFHEVSCHHVKGIWLIISALKN